MPAEPIMPCSFLRDFAVFPATSLDIRAVPALAALAMKAADAEMTSQASVDTEEQPEIGRIDSMCSMDSPRKASHGQLIVRNTFIEAPRARSPSLDMFYREREVQSSPPSGSLEVAVVRSPRRLGCSHLRVMSAVEEALAADARTEASSSSADWGGPPTATTAESTPKAGHAIPCEDGLSALFACSSGKIDCEYYYNTISGYTDDQYIQDPEDACACRSPATPINAGLSAVQYFGHSVGPPTALSTEPMVSLPDTWHPDTWQPKTPTRREMLRARGAVVAEAARRPSGSPMASSTTPSFFPEAHSACPSTQPGTFSFDTGPAPWLTGEHLHTLPTRQLSMQSPQHSPPKSLHEAQPPPPPPPPPPRTPTAAEAHKDSAFFGPLADSPNCLPSRGSMQHQSGNCKPCAFVFEGCNNGTACEFCHLCEPGERVRRKKEKLALRREEAKRRVEREHKEIAAWL